MNHKLSNALKDPQKPLPIAFVGGGINSAVGRVHRIAIELDKRFELVSGCFSREAKENIETGRDYGITDERLYDDLDGLLSHETGRIAAIVVLTPTPGHYKDIVKCLEAGIAVISEKALCMTSAEALELQQLSEQKRGFLAVTYNYSGYPMLRELKEMIFEGRLGKIHQIIAEMPQEGFLRLSVAGLRPTPQDWRLSDKALPTISLDLGVHLHQLVRFLTGESPLETIAVESSNGFFPAVIDNVSAITRYSGDMLCNTWYSKVSLGERNGFKVRIFGSEGSAEWIQTDPENLVFCDNRGTTQKIDRGGNAKVASQGRYTRFKAGHPSGFIEAFANLYADLAEALRAHHNGGNLPQEVAQYLNGAEVAAEGLAFLEAVKASVEGKCWTKIC